MVVMVICLKGGLNLDKSTLQFHVALVNSKLYLHLVATVRLTCTLRKVDETNLGENTVLRSFHSLTPPR